MDTASTTAPYMLFFRNSGPETHQHLSPTQRQTLVTRWNAWYDGLAAQGKAVEGQPLELETRMVSGIGGSRVVDGPFAEAKEAIGGYFLIEINPRLDLLWHFFVSLAALLPLAYIGEYGRRIARPRAVFVATCIGFLGYFSLSFFMHERAFSRVVVLMSALATITRSSVFSSRIFARTSRPYMPVFTISSITTSGFFRKYCSSAEGPSVASSTV